MKRLPLGLVAVFVIPLFFLFGGSLALILSVSFLLSRKDNLAPVVSSAPPNFRGAYNLFASPPPVLGSFTSFASTGDARALTLEQFFSKFHSPLASYSENFIESSEKYAIPWQLLPAISMQESSGGRNVPDGCFNPFGWGIHKNGTLCFTSWEEGIDKVAKGIKEKYIDSGLVTIEQIMSKYNPTSYNRDGSWGYGVQFFLDELASFNTP